MFPVDSMSAYEIQIWLAHCMSQKTSSCGYTRAHYMIWAAAALGKLTSTTVTLKLWEHCLKYLYLCIPSSSKRWLLLSSHIIKALHFIAQLTIIPCLGSCKVQFILCYLFGIMLKRWFLYLVSLDIVILKVLQVLLLTRASHHSTPPSNYSVWRYLTSLSNQFCNPCCFLHTSLIFFVTFEWEQILCFSCLHAVYFASCRETILSPYN